MQRVARAAQARDTGHTHTQLRATDRHSPAPRPPLSSLVSRTQLEATVCTPCRNRVCRPPSIQTLSICINMYVACNVDKTTQSTGFHCSHVPLPEKVALLHCLSPGPGGTWGVSSSSCSSLNSAGLKWHLKLSPAASLNSSRPFAHTWFLTRLGLAVGVGGRIRGKC